MTGHERAYALAKLHGAGNVFVVLDARGERGERAEAYAELARRTCAPHGPMDGADGLLVVCDPPPRSDAFVRMRVINADGSEAEMCGNGIRCVARYLVDRGGPDAFAIATLAGPIVVRVVAREPFVAVADLGAVRFPHDARAETFEALGATWTFVDVSLGNPHAVLFADALDAIDLDALGAAARTHPRFPHGTNLHLTRVVDARTLEVRHYERGVGRTAACGTGAVACAAAAIVTRGVASPVTVRVPGGTLDVAWRPGTTATLAGPAEPLFTRSIER